MAVDGPNKPGSTRGLVRSGAIHRGRPRALADGGGPLKQPLQNSMQQFSDTMEDHCEQKPLVPHVPANDARAARPPAHATQAGKFATQVALITTAATLATPSAPQEPAESSPMLAPQELAARLVTLVSSSVQSVPHPDLKALKSTAQRLFFQGNVPRADVLKVLYSVMTIADAQGDTALTQQCKALEARGYRDATASLQSAIDVLEQGKNAKGPNFAALMQLYIDTFKQTQSTLDATPSGKADHMDQASIPLQRAISSIERGQKLTRDMMSVIDSQTDKLSDKVKKMTLLREKMTLDGPEVSAARQVADDIIVAFNDALALLSLRKDVAVDAKLPGMAQNVQANQQAISSALMWGISAESIANRALAVIQLASLKSATAQQQDVILRSLTTGVPAQQIAPKMPQAAIMDRYLPHLTPLDVKYLQQQLQEGATFRQAWLGLPKFAVYPPVVPPRPTTADDQARSVEFAEQVKLSEQGAQEFARGIVAHAAAQNPRARSMVQDLDASHDIVARLQGVLSQLQPTAAQLNDQLSGRAFESALSTRLLEAMPLSTCDAWTKMARAMVHVIDHDDQLKNPDYFTKVSEAFRKNILHRGPRPWDNQQPDMVWLNEIARDPSAHMLYAARAFLDSPAKTGHDVIARANVVRDVWIAMEHAGLHAPMRQSANYFYGKALSKRTGRYEPDARAMASRNKAAPMAKRIEPTAVRPATGIMALHQAVPKGNQNAWPAKSPQLLNTVDISNQHVRGYLQQGAVTATGVSGSTNILLFFAEFARTTLGLDLPPRDIFLGAAEFVVHDGGHSFHEALWVQDHFADGKYSLVQEGTAAQSYAEILAAFNDVPEVVSAFNAAMSDLTGYHEELQRAAAGP